jgi:hypothetical protein
MDIPKDLFTGIAAVITAIAGLLDAIHRWWR